MAVFSAGFVEFCRDKKALRNKIYEKAKSELDSSAMKIAVKAGNGFVNFIAFLPKEKILRQNILDVAAKSQGKCVIVFELDYKQVGVICEEGMIIDYILDKPQLFAKERGYEVKFADNLNGQTLQAINLQKQKVQIYFSTVFFSVFLFVVFGGLYGGYEYFNTYKKYENQKQALEKEYEQIVQNNLRNVLAKIERIDSVNVLNDVEALTKQTKTRLRQIALKEKRLCVQLLVTDESELGNYDFKGKEILTLNDKTLFGYCYEKI
jgi:cell division protein FtsB